MKSGITLTNRSALILAAIILLCMLAASFAIGYGVGHRVCESARDREILDMGVITIRTADGRLEFIDYSNGASVGAVDLSQSDDRAVIVRVVNQAR